MDLGRAMSVAASRRAAGMPARLRKDAEHPHRSRGLPEMMRKDFEAQALEALALIDIEGFEQALLH